MGRRKIEWFWEADDGTVHGPWSNKAVAISHLKGTVRADGVKNTSPNRDPSGVLFKARQARWDDYMEDFPADGLLYSILEDIWQAAEDRGEAERPGEKQQRALAKGCKGLTPHLADFLGKLEGAGLKPWWLTGRVDFAVYSCDPGGNFDVSHKR